MEEVLVFPSTFYMLRSEELLKRKGCPLRLVPAPPQAGELCTTAIAVPSAQAEEIVGYLEGEKILIKAVLPYGRRLERYLAEALQKAARERPLPPALGRMLGSLGGGRDLAVEEIAELLALAESEEEGVVAEAAEAAVRAYSSGKVTALVGIRLKAVDGGLRAAPPGGRERARPCGLREMADLAEEMRAQGFVHLLLDVDDVADIAWTPAELKAALGEGVVTVMAAACLSARAGELVAEGAVRQFLLRREGIFALDARGLAEEIVFLRDNRPGPVGSGNLVPLLCCEGEVGAGDTGRIRAVLAVCRLVLGDAFLPAPPVLWRMGKLAGANMPVLDVTGRRLEDVAEEAEERLGGEGLSLKRVRRGGQRELEGG